MGEASADFEGCVFRVRNPEAAEIGLGSEWEARKQRQSVQTSFLECVGF